MKHNPNKCENDSLVIVKMLVYKVLIYMCDPYENISILSVTCLQSETIPSPKKIQEISILIIFNLESAIIVGYLFICLNICYSYFV